MTDTLTDLVQRLDRLEARDNIRRLKHRYAQICDTGYDGAAFADLFTLDGVWESNTFGIVRGRREIREFINGIGATEFSWAVHYMTCLDIVLGDGATTATGTWQLLQLCTRISTGEPEPILATADYQDELVRTGDVWQFSKVSVTFHHVADLRTGWGAHVLPGLAR